MTYEDTKRGGIIVDKNQNGIPDKNENYIMIIVGCIMVLSGLAGFFFSDMSIGGTISLCTLGSALLGGERIKTYLKNKR